MLPAGTTCLDPRKRGIGLALNIVAEGHSMKTIRQSQSSKKHQAEQTLYLLPVQAQQLRLHPSLRTAGELATEPTLRLISAA
jgi:hypothetical protein